MVISLRLNQRPSTSPGSQSKLVRVSFSWVDFVLLFFFLPWTSYFELIYRSKERQDKLSEDERRSSEVDMEIRNLGYCFVRTGQGGKSSENDWELGVGELMVKSFE